MGKDHTLEDEDVIQIVKKWNSSLSSPAGPIPTLSPGLSTCPKPFLPWQLLDRIQGRELHSTCLGVTLCMLDYIKDLVGHPAMYSSCVFVRICFGMDWMGMGMYSKAAVEAVLGNSVFNAKRIQMWLQHLTWCLVMGNCSVLSSGLSQMVLERGRTWLNLTGHSCKASPFASWCSTVAQWRDLTRGIRAGTAGPPLLSCGTLHELLSLCKPVLISMETLIVLLEWRLLV